MFQKSFLARGDLVGVVLDPSCFLATRCLDSGPSGLWLSPDPDMVRGKRVLVVEDGPTLTHGGMKIGAGVVAAMQHGATAFVDPRPYLQGSLVDTFRTYPDIGTVLPAMGYGADQMKDLAATIEATDCDVVVIGTPIDLSRVLEIGKPHTRVTYDLDEIGHPDMDDVLSGFVEALGLA